MKSNKNLAGDSKNRLEKLEPPVIYQQYRIGMPVKKNDIQKTAEVFDWAKLNGYELIETGKPTEIQEYSTVNNFNETQSCWSLGIGAKVSIPLDVVSIEAGYSMSMAKANLETKTTESAFMFSKFKNNYIRLNYGSANTDKIVASLKEPVAKLYWKIVLASTFYERLEAYRAFTQLYGIGCIIQLDLISYAVAAVEYKDAASSSSSKDEHEATLGASFGTAASVAFSTKYLQSASNKKKDLEFSAIKAVFPAESPTRAWVTDLFDKAINKIILKDWTNVKDPTVVPVTPVIPPFPKVDPKKSDETSCDSLNSDFNAIKKNTKEPYRGLKMYNIAEKELDYAKRTSDTKKIQRAQQDKRDAIEQLKSMVDGGDLDTLGAVIIDQSTIKLNDLSIPYIYAQSVLGQTIENVNYADAFAALRLKYERFFNGDGLTPPVIKQAFIDEAAVTAFVKELKGPEITNVNNFANVTDSNAGATGIALTPDSKKRVKELYNKTKKMKVELLNDQSEVPVTEKQYQDCLLEIQMKNDCLQCTDVEVYKEKLKDIKASFKTITIIQEILSFEKK